MNHTDVNVKELSQKTREAGVYPTRVVMWEQDSGTFATHLEVFPNDRKDNSPFFIWGNYDMSVGEALTDFDTRCAQLKVERVGRADGKQKYVLRFEVEVEAEHEAQLGTEINQIIEFLEDAIEPEHYRWQFVQTDEGFEDPDLEKVMRQSEMTG